MPRQAASTLSRADKLGGPRGGMYCRGRRLMRSGRMAVFGLFVQHEHAVRRQIVASGERVSGQEIVHRFVKVQAHRRTLVIQEEENPLAVLLTHTDLDRVRHFEQWVEAAEIAQPV